MEKDHPDDPDIDADAETDAEKKLPVAVRARQNLVTFIAFIQTKQGKITSGVTVGLLLVTLLMMKACAPAQGSILYGICRAFAEQHVSFPQSLVPNRVEQYQSAVRISYHHTDSFGQYLGEYIECSFVRDPDKGLMLGATVYNTPKAITNKNPIKNKGRLYAVEQEVIDLFNRSGSVQAIIAAEPDLTLPRYQSLNLRGG